MKKFAKYYDDVYYDKDYSKECNFIKKILKKNNVSGTRILDLGCGTGGHALLLSKTGFNVTGVDLSKQMITLAKTKAKNSKFPPNFVHGDMTNVVLEQKYDICIAMFSSLCYLTNISVLKKALLNIFKHLKKDGILIFDFWNGNAVLHQMPSTKKKIIKNKSLKILRTSSPELNIRHQTCAINYQFSIYQNSKLIDKFSETHTMRYHFMDDLYEYLKESGFSNIDFKPTVHKKNSSKNNLLLENWYLYAISRK